MLGIARLTAARLDDHVGDVRQLLATLAAVADPDASPATNDALLRRLLGGVPAEINGLSLWNADGRNVGASNVQLRGQSPDVAQRRFFVDAMAGSTLAVEAPVRSIANGQSVVVFALPIRRDGRVIGVAAASTHIERLQAGLSKSAELPPGAVITIADVSGTVVARTVDSERWVGKVIALPTGTQGVQDGRSTDGVERIGGYTASNRLPWLVYVGIPTAAAMQPFRDRQIQSALVGVALLLLSSVGALAITRRISNALGELTRDALQFKQGDWRHRSSIGAGDEFGTLANILNGMADTVQESSSSLLSSREQLRAVTDNLPVMISYLDTEQRFRFANCVYHEWIGQAPEALLGRSLCEVYGADEYAQFAQYIARGLTGQRVVYERDLQSVRGARRVEVTLIPHIGADGIVRGLYTLMHDVTAARTAVALLERSEQRLSFALDGAGSALFDWDIDANRLYHSAHAAALRGEEAREEMPRPEDVIGWIHPTDREAVVASLSATLSGEREQHDVEFRISHVQGGWVWIRSRGRVVEHKPDGSPRRLAGTYSDITQRKNAEIQLRKLATYDTLTGLPNRASFNERLNQALTRHAQGTQCLAVLFLDLDHFKAVNDTFGHAAGDRLLVDFGRLLQSAVRGTDTVARLAGDEFTIILEGLRVVEDALTVAEALVAGARRTVGEGEAAVIVTASIGIAIVSAGEIDPGAVLRRADLALYAAKRAGRNRYAIQADGLPPDASRLRMKSAGSEANATRPALEPDDWASSPILH